jgi:hypothetical protein
MTIHGTRNQLLRRLAYNGDLVRQTPDQLAASQGASEYGSSESGGRRTEKTANRRLNNKMHDI